MGKNLLCILSSHKFGGWEYVALDSCEETLTCTRCGHEKERRLARHEFSDGWKYVAPDSCEKVLTCTRCGYKEKKRLARHDFGDGWEYVAPDSCKEVLICTRCRFTSWRKIHQYGAWEHRAEGTLVQICQRCGDEFYGKLVAQNCIKCSGSRAVEMFFPSPGDILCDYCKVNQSSTCPLCYGTGWIKYPSVFAIECIECGAVLHAKKVELGLQTRA